MLTIGLTGGIGAGKSEVARLLAGHGAVVIDADQLAREVVAPGTEGLREVVDAFGPAVLDPHGALDRTALATAVFDDQPARQRLEQIIHPRVRARTAELTRAAPPDAIVVNDVPLLVENRLGDGYHLVLVVDAPAQERVRRLVEARGMAADEVWSRVRAQADDEARAAAADVWLDNRGTRAALRAGVDALWSARLVPFEANLRHHRPAPRSPRAVLVQPDPTWPPQAERLIARIRRVAGERADRIEHIGSTAVPGLPAKEVLDVQVVVADLRAAAALAEELGGAGLVRMPGEWYDGGRDGSRHPKVVACNADPGRAANVHLRERGSPAWRDALLLRDWLAAHPAAVTQYAALKWRLAEQPHESIDAYASAKSPWIHAALARADAWAARTGWTPASS